MIIYAVKINDERIATILNFIKYICEPNSKTEVHLSIRGPYKRRLPLNKVGIYNKGISNTLIHVMDVGTFFGENQNTVFLKCDSVNLEKIWMKVSYGYNPHLTLYDGKERGFAVELYNILKENKLSFSFHSSELIQYDTSKKNSSMLLTMGINYSIINEIMELDFSKINPIIFQTKKKLEIIKKCIGSLRDYLNTIRDQSISINLINE